MGLPGGRANPEQMPEPCFQREIAQAQRYQSSVLTPLAPIGLGHGDADGGIGNASGLVGAGVGWADPRAVGLSDLGLSANVLPSLALPEN